MFSFGLFSTHLPFILIGIVSFISMGYAHFYKAEKQIDKVVKISFEERLSSLHATANYYGSNYDQDNSCDCPEKKSFEVLFVKTSHLPPQEGIPLLTNDLIFQFFARPPPVIS
jgi:hypothetical protein